MKTASLPVSPNSASDPRLSLRYTQLPGVIGQSIHSPFGCVNTGGAAATGLVGCGAGAGSGGAVEQDASASKSSGMDSGAGMILIVKEYGQKRGARLVLICNDPV